MKKILSIIILLSVLLTAGWYQGGYRIYTEEEAREAARAVEEKYGLTESLEPKHEDSRSQVEIDRQKLIDTATGNLPATSNYKRLGFKAADSISFIEMFMQNNGYRLSITNSAGRSESGNAYLISHLDENNAIHFGLDENNYVATVSVLGSIDGSYESQRITRFIITSVIFYIFPEFTNSDISNFFYTLSETPTFEYGGVSIFSTDTADENKIGEFFILFSERQP